MAEYIEREELLRIEKLLDTEVLRASKTASNIYDQILYDIENFPAADVVPVVHGKWLDFYKDFSTAECCKCGELFEVSSGREAKKAFFELFKGFYKYCPNCGAKMDLEDENEPA